MATTLDALVDALPLDLVPTSPLPRPARRISGVHISELVDPTPFLSGGELLLTTGIGLHTQITPLTGYVTRLTGAGVAALGFGVGPVHAQVPDALRAAAQRAGLPLLIVPAERPFQSIVRQFFADERHAERQDLTGALGAMHALVSAATHGEPGRDQARRQVIRVLAGAVEGWAAHVDATGRPVAVWPDTAIAAARRAGTEVARIEETGALAGATFPLGGDDVLLQPVGGSDGGYVACGRARPIPTQLRHLTLAACAVLELAAARMSDAALLRAAGPVVVGRLLWLGRADAAVDYARAGGVTWPDLVRLGHTIGCRVLPGAPPGSELARHTAGDRTTWVWACDDAPSAWELLRASGLDAANAPGRGSAPARGVLGPAVPTSQIPGEWGRLAAQAEALPRGSWLDLATSGAVGDRTDAEAAAHHALAELSTYPGVDLVGTLAAYLAQRGRIEGTAAALGVHRNTVRHRLGLIARTAGVDVEDPDTAAHLWLALPRSARPGGPSGTTRVGAHDDATGVSGPKGVSGVRGGSG